MSISSPRFKATMWRGDIAVKFGRLRAVAICGALVVGGLESSNDGRATTISINFDVPQANYVPPPTVAGSTQVVDDQFGSLGLIIRDHNFPTLGAVVMGQDWLNCEPPQCSPPFVLAGNDNNGTGRPQTRGNIDLFFVDPNNFARPATTSFFSVEVTDG